MSAENGTNIHIKLRGNIPTWNLILNIIELIILVSGSLANLLMLICLIRHRMASHLTNLLLRIQCSVDASICILAIIYLLQPGKFWTTGYRGFDLFLCHVWHSQVIFWILVFLSIQNLVCIASDRFWAVVTPQTYKSRQTWRARICLSLTIVYSILVGTPNIFLTFFDGKVCVSRVEGAVKGRMDMHRIFQICFAVVWFSSAYVLPAFVFIFLYSRVIRTLVATRKFPNSSTQRVSRVNQLTCAMLVVTLIFILSLAFDCFYYLLSVIGVFDYIVNSPAQRVGLFLVSVNSSANVGVYCIFVSSFRRHLISTMCCQCSRWRRQISSSNSTSGIGNDQPIDNNVETRSVHFNQNINSIRDNEAIEMF